MDRDDDLLRSETSVTSDASSPAPAPAPPPIVPGLERAAWAFADALRDGLYVIDTAGRCVFVNRAALDMLGYGSEAELIGRHMHDAVHHTRPDGSPFPAAACPLLHTLASGRPVRLDSELLWRRDGSCFAADYASYPVMGASAAPIGSVVTFSAGADGGAAGTAVADRWGGLERRRAEEALRESEAKFRALADNIAQLAWMTDADGAIEWYNRRWYDYTGTTFEDVRGWGWTKVHHPDHVEGVKERIAARFAEGLPWEDTFPLRGRDGQYRWFLSSAVPIHGMPDARNPDGRLLGWFGTNTDITELREAEHAAAAARDAAEEANRAKSDFIANMSHELRTPLSAIIGYSEMLQEEMAAGTTAAELTPDMHKIEANARHLLGLINDVLDMSKIESGRMEVYPEAFAVEPLLREVAATAETLATRRGNGLALALGPDLGTMRTDVTKLRQILLNLLSNAAKFTERGTITLSAMRLPGGEGGDWMMVRVADTGIGMTEEQLGRLFQRFAQADSSTTRRFGGTGLGLSISKAFGVMLGGDLSVESRPGEGSTFTVFLPAEVAVPTEAGDAPPPDAAPAPDGRDTSTAAGGRPVALVIDDSRAQRDLMSRFLAREGFDAVTAADGAAGLDLARSLHPRVILLDVMMPGLDGWSVLSALKADDAVRDIPVVMVTFLDERGPATALGAADYVMKPVRWERFRQVMDRYRAGEGTVLVVEDDADTRRHIRSVLERDGWSVVEAEHGRAALERVAEAVPRVVLLDLEMPVMDGFAFLRAFRERPGCAAVPVVVLTARDLTRDDRRRLQSASEVLSKGVTTLADLSRELRGVAGPRAPDAAPSGRHEADVDPA